MLKTTSKNFRRWASATLLLGSAVTLSGCHTDMWAQNKMKPYYESDFFADRSELRPIVANTVPQDGLEARLDDAYSRGRLPNGKFLPQIPPKSVGNFNSPKDMLLRGKDRYTAYCSPCHGNNGDGNGMITQRGLGYWQKLPATYYTDRLRKVEDGYLYDVLVNGHGVMYGYGSRIQNIDDRWAVISYVRALQLAHNANPSLAPAGTLQAVEAEEPAKMPSGSPELTENAKENAEQTGKSAESPESGKVTPPGPAATSPETAAPRGAEGTTR
jgi:mono/diheme cytochrome c family protein